MESKECKECGSLTGYHFKRCSKFKYVPSYKLAVRKEIDKDCTCWIAGRVLTFRTRDLRHSVKLFVISFLSFQAESMTSAPECCCCGSGERLELRLERIDSKSLDKGGAHCRP